ncbi:hypothetical protein AMECASPLE_035780 [Ameca splendens]|uniref:Uncharacterized protein n=1 Tax=Ameca splendens TaxID=208324 RepID=A0ABV0YUL9_9TELE
MTWSVIFQSNFSRPSNQPVHSMAEKSADLTLTVGHTHTDHNLHHFADVNVERFSYLKSCLVLIAQYHHFSITLVWFHGIHIITCA